MLQRFCAFVFSGSEVRGSFQLAIACTFAVVFAPQPVNNDQRGCFCASPFHDCSLGVKEIAQTLKILPKLSVCDDNSEETPLLAHHFAREPAVNAKCEPVESWLLTK